MSIQLKPGFVAPRLVKYATYHLVPLGPEHNDADFAAWKESEERLKGVFGSRNGWPGEVASLEQNLSDLTNDRREFDEGIAFRYAILTPEGTDYLGCLYLRPAPPKYDVQVDLWFAAPHVGMEPGFLENLRSWLAEVWGFAAVAYPGREISWADYYAELDAVEERS